MSGGSNQPIIIKKKKGGSHGGHHGGAWKVAYADFVTAMMAFFLLLWLLNVTTDDQRRGIADYFDPGAVSRGTSGSGGVLGGLTVGTPGQMSSPSAQFSMHSSLPGTPYPDEESEHLDEHNGEDLGDDVGSGGTGPSQIDGDGDEPGIGAGGDSAGDGEDGNAQGQDGSESGTGFGAEQPPLPEQQMAEAVERYLDSSAEEQAEMLEEIAQELGEQAMQQMAEAFEQAQFDETAEELRQAISTISGVEFENLSQHLIVENAPQGLRIEIVDQDRASMFPNGSPSMNGRARELMRLVAEAISPLPNRIAISGHTDSTRFINGGSYDNWDLSTDRANASRRALLEFGIAEARIETVVGRADTDPVFPEEPDNPRNRRISIVLLRDGAEA